MKCAEVRELLGNYMDQELTESMMRLIERHLLRCPPCAYEARSIEQACHMLQESAEPPMVSEQLGERILRHIAERFPHLKATCQSEEPFSLPLLPLEEGYPAEPCHGR